MSAQAPDGDEFDRGSDLESHPSARGVYGISVAAELSGVGVQTLRAYERLGLLTPTRTDGGTRRYSDNDLHRIARITALSAQGVNLAGISHILDLQDRNTALHTDNTALHTDNTRLSNANRQLRHQTQPKRPPARSETAAVPWIPENG